MSDDGNTYTRCSVQLSLFSLIQVTTLIGGSGGVVWAGILAFLDMISLIELDNFKNYLANFIFFPILAAFFGALFSVVGYPLYSWVCKHKRGQKLTGIFDNPHN